MISARDSFNFDADADPDPGSTLEKMDPDPGHETFTTNIIFWTKNRSQVYMLLGGNKIQTGCFDCVQLNNIHRKNMIFKSC